MVYNYKYIYSYRICTLYVCLFLLYSLQSGIAIEFKHIFKYNQNLLLTIYFAINLRTKCFYIHLQYFTEQTIVNKRVDMS